jgi:hypothetical protein
MKDLLTKLLDPMKDVREQYEKEKKEKMRLAAKRKLLTRKKK